MSKFFAFVFLLLTVPSFGQHDLGISGGAGISYFTTRFSDPYNFEQKFSICATIQGGLYYNYHLQNKLHFGAEVVWMEVEGHETLKSANTDNNGNPTGQYTTVNIFREISFIGVPINFGYSIKKWTFSMGALLHFPVRSAYSENGYGVDQYNQAFEWNHDGGELNIDPYNFAIRPGISYELSNLFLLNANYSITTNNILNSFQLNPVWMWRIQTLTIGLQFRIISPSSEEQNN